MSSSTSSFCFTPSSSLSLSQLLTQLESASITSIEHATTSEYLLAFRSSSQPYMICRHLLSQTTHAAAQFIALITIKEAMLREWVMIYIYSYSMSTHG